MVEVGRKFLPILESITGLRADTGMRPFISYHPLGFIIYHGIYYDSAGELMKRGIYVRVRKGDWEAKVRSGGDFINSQFTEYNKREEIQEILETISRKTGHEELDGFRVVVDETNFGHCVGEVGLCHTFDVNTIHTLCTSGQGLATAGKKMDHKIYTVMNKYRWAFPLTEGGKVMGKLAAYMLLVENQ